MPMEIWVVLLVVEIGVFLCSTTFAASNTVLVAVREKADLMWKIGKITVHSVNAS